MKVKIYKANSLRRKVRTRSKIKGTAKRPRLSVFRSNRYIYAQLVDDLTGKTLLGVNDLSLNTKGKNKKDRAFEVGKKVGEYALKLGIFEAVFDRGSYKYHGRVKLLADGAREGKLKF